MCGCFGFMHIRCVITITRLGNLLNLTINFIFTFQSHVWNRIATERIKRWGLRPVVGDLYIKNKTGSSNKDKVNTDVQVVHDPTGVDIFEIVLPVR
jgi:tRNA(Glu) U13 pseudouridine synthase TruD